MPGTFGSGTFGGGSFGGGDSTTQTPPPPTAGAAERILVREQPPLRTHIIVENSVGRRWRWGQDESQPENVFSSLRYSDTMPGGFETLDCTLSRHPAQDYNDLERFSTIYVYGAGGESVGEYRLERAPQTSGNQMSVSPSAVGWQANLEDNKSAKEIYVHADMSAWKGVSVQRKLALAGTFKFYDGNVEPDATTGQPAIATTFTGPWGTTDLPVAEAWFDANNIPLFRLAASWKKNANVDGGGGDPFPAWHLALYSDDVGTAGEASADLQGIGPGIGATIDATLGNRVFARLMHQYQTGPIAGSNEYTVWWTFVNVIGQHGLPLHGTFTATSGQGVLASDVVEHAVGEWAPQLNTTAESIQASTFVIPHLAFLEPTTVGEIIRQATRFGLQDWGVWNDKTFWWHNRGYNSRYWRARISPSQFEETGSSGENVWNSIVVQYSDVDGTTRTVGPVGSGAHTESSLLEDADPENPATKANLTRRDILQMGTATPAGAIEVGRRFLEESKLIDRSGRMQLVGHVESRNGNLYPYSAVRAGDFISIVDAADMSYRRVVRTDKDHSTRTCSVDLDAPPEALQALLERLSAVLIPLGVT